MHKRKTIVAALVSCAAVAASAAPAQADFEVGMADQDFRIAPAITDALRARVDHENYGYMRVPDSYLASIADWNIAGRNRPLASPHQVVPSGDTFTIEPPRIAPVSSSTA